MATVYLAQDLRHKRRVALQVLDPELGAVVGGERFRREIEMAAELQHPHVLPVFDSGEAGTGGLWSASSFSRACWPRAGGWTRRHEFSMNRPCSRAMCWMHLQRRSQATSCGTSSAAERLGDRSCATEAYRYVTEAWQHPDPELEPYAAEGGQDWPGSRRSRGNDRVSVTRV